MEIAGRHRGFRPRERRAAVLAGAEAYRTATEQFAAMGNPEVWEAMAEKERLLHADATFESERYAQLEDIIMRYQGYSLEARAAEIL